jgi:DNA-binding Lrp family transcriptional regulator
MREWEEQLRTPQVCYVLLNTSSRGHTKVEESLREKPGVVEVYKVTGDYNMVVKISSDDIEQFAGAFSSNLKRIPGVKQVKTLIPTSF